MDLSTITDTIKDQTQVAAVVGALDPFLPAMKREGKVFADQLLDLLINGQWAEVDQVAWVKMTDAERDKLSDQILADARAAVDQEFERKSLARQIAFKIASSLVLSLI